MMLVLADVHLRARSRSAQSDTNPWEVIGGFISPTHDAYGKKSLAPMRHRINMTELALRDSDWINVDTWECAQEG
jgi:nicotinamide mononucleotide adenylyltransferase